MAAETEYSQSRHSRSSNLGSVLQNWIVAHNGRLWQTTEETSSITEQTGFTKSQIKNWFASQRKNAGLALERALENPGEFISGYDSHAAKTLKHFFATVAEHGYLPEAGKTLIAESTGLSTRSIVDFFDKYREDPRFAHAAAFITNMETPNPGRGADAAQPTDIPIPRSPVSPPTTPRATVPVQVSQSSAPPQLMQVERVAGTAPHPAITSVASPAITQSSKKRKRNSSCSQDGKISMFAWHRGRQVNLTTEVEPLLRKHPGVQSATCLS